MVLTNKTDEKLIKEIEKLWLKRTGEMGRFGFICSCCCVFLYDILIYIFNSFLTPTLIMVGLIIAWFIFSEQKYKYYKQPHVYEKNTRDLWEYKRELEHRGYDVKVMRTTEVTAEGKRIYDNVVVIKREQ